MAHVLIVAIITFALLFGGMMVLGVLVAYPWILIPIIGIYLWKKGEVRSWLSTRTT